MGPVSGTKTRLRISPCDMDGDIAKVNGETPFEAMINPAGYSHTASNLYVDNEAMGPGNEKKYSRSEPEKVEFKQLILDGTGVVEGSRSVGEQVALLRKVAYDYKGSKHQPPVVEVSWGPLLFKAHMESMKVEYTLFKPSGEPLRAKIGLTFVAYKSTEEIFKAASLESPDLTHRVEVKAGDTLPLLCHRIYQDSSYYLAVARLNRLRHFRDLQPGQVLRFPPLV